VKHILKKINKKFLFILYCLKINLKMPENEVSGVIDSKSLASGVDGSKVNSDRIRACIIGVGNCCTSLITGIVSYAKNQDLTGITYGNIGGYKVDSIDFPLAFDVDKRKVGKPINEAILQKPNCTPLLCSEDDLKTSSIEFGMVYKSKVLDGVPEHLSEFPDDERFIVDDSQPECTREEICQLLKDNKIDVVVNYLPVGSQEAVEFWAQICLDNSISLLNCMPIFIVSNPKWSEQFEAKGIVICGDDMQSQLGSSIVSSRLTSLMIERGMDVQCSLQSNAGGNSDFAVMLARDRLKSKKISKENVLKNQFIVANKDIGETFLQAGPSEYIRYYKDMKVAHIRIEAKGFGGYPMILDCRMSVIDSANSAGVVIDSLRFIRVAQRLGKSGPLYGPCAFYQKTPPKAMKFEEAKRECDELAATRFD
jgi:myo-inositol-1-phosphate synthase